MSESISRSATPPAMVRRPVVIPWIFPVLLSAGILAAGLMMYAAWQHDPQGEFHDEIGIQWSSWLWVGASWFGAVTVIPSIVIGVIQRWISRPFRIEKLRP